MVRLNLLHVVVGVLALSTHLVSRVAADTINVTRDEGGKPQEVEAYVAMLFPWFAQLLGVISLHLISRFAPDLPYTAALFALGVLIVSCPIALLGKRRSCPLHLSFLTLREKHGFVDLFVGVGVGA
jgi:hypothetical protein